MSNAERAHQDFVEHELGHIYDDEIGACKVCKSDEQHGEWHEREHKNAEFRKQRCGFANGSELAEAVANFLNGADTTGMREFAFALTRYEHRTIQQQVFALFLHAVKEWAECTSGNRFDGRNEYTVKSSKKIMDLLGTAWAPFI